MKSHVPIGFHCKALIGCRSLSRVNVSAVCNADCACSESRYSPVCSSLDVMYYSSCYAGCHSSRTLNKKKVSAKVKITANVKLSAEVRGARSAGDGPGQMVRSGLMR